MTKDAHRNVRADLSAPRHRVNPGSSGANPALDLYAPGVLRAWVRSGPIMTSQRRPNMTITPELILALATLVTAVSGLIWTLRRRR